MTNSSAGRRRPRRDYPPSSVALLLEVSTTTSFLEINQQRNEANAASDWLRGVVFVVSSFRLITSNSQPPWLWFFSEGIWFGALHRFNFWRALCYGDRAPNCRSWDPLPEASDVEWVHCSEHIAVIRFSKNHEMIFSNNWANMCFTCQTSFSCWVFWSSSSVLYLMWRARSSFRPATFCSMRERWHKVDMRERGN